VPDATDDDRRADLMWEHLLGCLCSKNLDGTTMYCKDADCQIRRYCRRLNRRIGQKRAAAFKAAINNRWHQLEGLVESYNSELEKLKTSNDNDRYPDVLRLRKLNPKALKDEGLDNSEIWDVDMALCNSDWAVFDIVRQGIEAIFVQWSTY